MRNPFKTWSESKEADWQANDVKSWERTRAKGMWLFILKIDLVWGLWMSVTTSLFEFWDGMFSVQLLRFKVLSFFMVGLMLGVYLWYANEAKYQENVRRNP